MVAHKIERLRHEVFVNLTFPRKNKTVLLQNAGANTIQLDTTKSNSSWCRRVGKIEIKKEWVAPQAHFRFEQLLQHMVFSLDASPASGWSMHIFSNLQAICRFAFEVCIIRRWSCHDMTSYHREALLYMQGCLECHTPFSGEPSCKVHSSAPTCAQHAKMYTPLSTNAPARTQTQSSSSFILFIFQDGLGSTCSITSLRAPLA